jgi:hypothetical protein
MENFCRHRTKKRQPEGAMPMSWHHDQISRVRLDVTSNHHRRISFDLNDLRVDIVKVTEPEFV